ncbi:uncharacterized protein LOC129951467 [Eupeodes corollae]|uniref:uncharacterized protein LOC129951467 n=1 Tax=Eupeodes corollae TaxID=290404 RepID=UPI002491E886|nr:uncharacterized protein LOC129951467 [Eupeodes corollae]
MNYNRIIRASNFLFVFCGYQCQWFNVEDRKCKLNVVSVIYAILLAFWYAACFRQHFLDSSIFNFLISTIPILHTIIRMHLLIGLKTWLFVIFEMKHVTKALNNLIKTLPPQTYFSWCWEDIKVYIWLFSGLLINFGFALYIMIELEFRLPTLNQVMHGSALFLPHFALACSFKVLNLASLFARSELQSIHSKLNCDIKTESTSQKKTIESLTDNSQNSVELSGVPPQISGIAIQIPDLETLQMLVKRLEGLALATRTIDHTIQKQMIFLFLMNSLSLLGASYSIVYYKSTWHLILDESVGNCLYVFNVGIFVFIFWDLFSLCVVNYIFEKERNYFLKDVIQILRSKLPLEDDKRVLLRDVKYLLKNNFCMQIFFNMSIKWQTLVMINALVGLAISIFITFHYLDDNIENLETQINADED